MFSDDAKDGENELAVITRGLSVSLSQSAVKYKIGNDDKIITSFNKNENFFYEFGGACGVIYQGLIHFFGSYSRYYQHLGFDQQRNFVKYQNLNVRFDMPQCSTFKIRNSQFGEKEVVLLCFDRNHRWSCYKYDDGELTHFNDANEDHALARLGKYRDQLVTVGDVASNQKTEILDESFDGEYKWTLGPDYNFSRSGYIYDYSMVNIPKMGSNEEYLLLIGGQFDWNLFLKKVHKYNGSWSFFGNLRKTRAHHNTVLLNGRVFILGGRNHGDYWTKTEIWDTAKSRFKTELTWPELYWWTTASNNAFIVPDYVNP